MGAPLRFAREAQVRAGRVHLEATIEALRTYEFSRRRGTTLIVEEPIGVCALITPWNWPLNQIACKVAPALAAGCTMVLKPSEIAPISGVIFAEIVEAAGAPAGVFNLVNGDGPSVGQAMAGHPDVDMVSFTGSTRAGIIVAKAAADTVKRVAQELGGKSPNIILPDADFEAAVRAGVAACFANSGQSCDAPTRMLVPAERHGEAMAIAAAAARPEGRRSPRAGVDLGPVASQAQFDKVQRLIGAGIDEGATLVAGGLGRPAGLDARLLRQADRVRRRDARDDDRARGDLRPGSVDPRLRRRGRGGRASPTTPSTASRPTSRSRDIEHARAVAARLRAGTVNINYPAWDIAAPFGGYKQSGNGREYADYGMREYLETKAIVGYGGRSGRWLGPAEAPAAFLDNRRIHGHNMALSQPANRKRSNRCSPSTTSRASSPSAPQRGRGRLLHAARCSTRARRIAPRSSARRRSSWRSPPSRQDEAAVRAEAADVLYHLLVVLRARGVALADVMGELERRTRRRAGSRKRRRARK